MIAGTAARWHAGHRTRVGELRKALSRAGYDSSAQAYDSSRMAFRTGVVAVQSARRVT